MNTIIIATVDATRARLFTLERESTPERLRESLVETSDLVNPARHLRPSELFSDSRPGSNRTGNLQYTFDDHRDAHIAEFDAGFARAIVDEITKLLKTTGAKRLIVCASPNMLGVIRRVGTDLYRGGIVLDTLPRDLVKLDPPVLRDYLTRRGLLPAEPPRPHLESR